MTDKEPEHEVSSVDGHDVEVAEGADDADVPGDDEPLSTWQPPRGAATRVVAWLILILLALCLLSAAAVVLVL